jgi:hypothetical protein
LSVEFLVCRGERSFAELVLELRGCLWVWRGSSGAAEKARKGIVVVRGCPTKKTLLIVNRQLEKLCALPMLRVVSMILCSIKTVRVALICGIINHENRK